MGFVPALKDFYSTLILSFAVSVVEQILPPTVIQTHPIPTLTGKSLELSKLSLSGKVAPQLFQTLGLGVGGEGLESKGAEPTSSTLAVGWLDLDRPVHLKERRKGSC